MSEPPAVVGLVDAREQRDDAYRAIGRYTVAFSLLVAGMREIIAVHIADGQKRDVGELALGSLMAQQVADPLFAICRSVADLDRDEQAVEKCLREQVNEEIRERNRIMHGDWLIARWTRDDFKAPTAALVRVSVGHQGARQAAQLQRGGDRQARRARRGVAERRLGVRDDLH
jgi:hypothetical protein